MASPGLDWAASSTAVGSWDNRTQYVPPSLLMCSLLTFRAHLCELIITNENLGPKEDAGLNQSLILRQILSSALMSSMFAVPICCCAGAVLTTGTQLVPRTRTSTCSSCRYTCTRTRREAVRLVPAVLVLVPYYVRGSRPSVTALCLL